MLDTSAACVGATSGHRIIAAAIRRHTAPRANLNPIARSNLVPLQAPSCPQRFGRIVLRPGRIDPPLVDARDAVALSAF